jgi:group I intron endonuclease
MYVGQAFRKKGIKGRFSEHKAALKSNRHYNEHLQHSWNKYGGDNFEFIILEEVQNIENLDEREQYWIDYHWNNSYNMQPTAGGSSLGIKRTKETKAKISEANRMRTWTEESKLKLSKSQKERYLKYGTPDSVRESRRQAQLGRKHTEEEKKKISQGNLGKTFSEETKNKLRLSHLGKKCTEESKRKQSLAMAKRTPCNNLYKGVRQRTKNCWCARITNGDLTMSQHFNNPIDAAKYYDRCAISIYGVGNCYLNFPCDYL